MAGRDTAALRYLLPVARQKFLAYTADLPGQLTPDQGGQLAREGAILKALYDGGVGLLLGTDAFWAELPGFTVHDELAAFVRAGLTPYQALETGTRNVAAYFGTLDSTGTVAVGKRADLVLLAGNPLQDIRRTAHPVGVMIGGRWLSRVLIDQVLDLVENTLPG